MKEKKNGRFPPYPPDHGLTRHRLLPEKPGGRLRPGEPVRGGHAAGAERTGRDRVGERVAGVADGPARGAAGVRGDGAAAPGRGVGRQRRAGRRRAGEARRGFRRPVGRPAAEDQRRGPRAAARPDRLGAVDPAARLPRRAPGEQAGRVRRVRRLVRCVLRRQDGGAPAARVGRAPGEPRGVGREARGGEGRAGRGQSDGGKVGGGAARLLAEAGGVAVPRGGVGVVARGDLGGAVPDRERDPHDGLHRRRRLQVGPRSAVPPRDGREQKLRRKCEEHRSAKVPPRRHDAALQRHPAVAKVGDRRQAGLRDRGRQRQRPGVRPPRTGPAGEDHGGRRRHRRPCGAAQKFGGGGTHRRHLLAERGVGRRQRRGAGLPAEEERPHHLD